jgi:hypothetical protein
MEGEDGVFAHLCRSLAVYRPPCSVGGVGELVRRHADSVAILDVELQETAVQSPIVLIPTPWQAGCSPELWARKNP